MGLEDVDLKGIRNSLQKLETQLAELRGHL